MDWIHATKLQAVDTPAHWLSRQHNEVFSSFTGDVEVHCFYLRGDQAGKGGGGVILNHALIQQKMTVIVDVLHIKFNPWKRK